MIGRPADRLGDAGMSDAARAIAADAFDTAFGAWRALGAPAEPRWLFVPGRIEVLGKHTDYAGGTTLTCAVERGFCAVYSPREDDVLRLADAGRGQRTQFAIGPDLEMPPGGWPAFPRTVARRLARNFGLPLAGADVAFVSTLPGSAGMSSSSALITAVYLIAADVNGLADRPQYRQAIADRPALAGYLGSIENGSAFGPLSGDRGVGTFGGSEDHAAILCSRPMHVGVFEFCPVRLVAHLPLPGGCTFAVASSGIAADKTGNARDDYNRASHLVSEILRRWRDATGRTDQSLRDALRSAPAALEQIRAALYRQDGGTPALLRRLQHFVVENERLVPAAIAALAADDDAAFGDIVDESQRAAEELLGNQVPETVALARTARALGAVAASSFGAGFGGSVWALVHQADAARFLERWRGEYQKEASSELFARSRFFLTLPGPPASGSGQA